MNDPQFRLYVICSLILSFLLIFLSGFTGATRGRTKSPPNPEDAKLARTERVPEDHPDVIRVTRAHRNALENIPIFFTLGLIYVLVGAAPMGAQVCFIAFTAGRTLHAVFHLKGIQPWRSISYGIGQFSLVAMIVLIGMKVAA
jgi:prostaglandin-E synthase 1